MKNLLIKMYKHCVLPFLLFFTCSGAISEQIGWAIPSRNDYNLCTLEIQMVEKGLQTPVASTFSILIQHNGRRYRILMALGVRYGRLW
jgi:hypothetical protein